MYLDNLKRKEVTAVRLRADCNPLGRSGERLLLPGIVVGA